MSLLVLIAGANKMAVIITMAQQKGGATKTTNCMNIAGGLIEKGYSVQIVDMNNQQGSATKWAKRGEEFRDIVTLVSSKTPGKEIKEISHSADFVMIDIPPDLTPAALKAMLLSDLIIVPCQASPLDLDSLDETVDTIESMGKPFMLLASNLRKGTTLKGQLIETLKKIGKVFDTKIHQRVSIVEAAMIGKWIGSYAPKTEPHIEYRDLVSEILTATKDIK